MTKLENKMNFYFKNTKKDIIMEEEDEEHFRNTNICWFCEKEFLNISRVEFRKGKRL